MDQVYGFYLDKAMKQIWQFNSNRRHNLYFFEEDVYGIEC